MTQTREDALLEAVEQCESERRACERLSVRFPKNNVHATGVLIADVCARRVRALLGEDEDVTSPSGTIGRRVTAAGRSSTTPSVFGEDGGQ